MSEKRNDYDSPWKEILEAYFEECMAFFFPDVHSNIDWKKGYEFLDKELQQIVREADLGKRVADKLVKVWTASQQQIWIVVHIEVQSQSEGLFSQRMYTYNYRLRDLYNCPVASFAILSDSSTTWRPDTFSADQWGCTIEFKFRTTKLLDYNQQQEGLLSSDNPFAVVVLAHLKTLETTRDAVSRQQWKLRLIKLLYQRRYPREDVIKLFRFIDWLLVLPTALETSVWKDIIAYQKELNMPYMTSIEKIAKAEGKAEGFKLSIERMLEAKFGDEGLALFGQLTGLTDADVLSSLQAELCGNPTLDDLRDRYVTQPTKE